MHKGHFEVGTVEGTGATIIVQLGFTPQWVRILNIDGQAMLEWTKDMPDGYGVKTITDGTISKITSLGITPYGGTVAGNAKGFLIGADTDINVTSTAETMIYIAASSDS